MWSLEVIRRLNAQAATRSPSDIPGTDDALVPESIASTDPDRWAEYNRKFNDLISGRENAENQKAARAEAADYVGPRKEAN
jgi:hypothetical protein